MLGQTVTVLIDRPMYSKHPDYKDLIYPINYGYIEGVISPIDHEMLDAYILGVSEPINRFTGKVIAKIHRKNEEDKLVVATENYSKEDIFNATFFIEQYFDSNIEMAYTTKEDLLFDLKKSGLLDTDTVMIHSSLKSFGAIDGKDIIEAFKEYFSNGLIVFPTHTWATIQKDSQIFDVINTPSCVGSLTNIARLSDGFVRSMHPTHSVCAYGKGKVEYIKADLNSKTPVSPTGCFGILKERYAKIIFLGAPLSKNTFIHSIEEELNVPDRFTEHQYHFISQNGKDKIDYYMPRHYSTKSLHISDHYAKLLAPMLQKKIAYECFIGNSRTVVVDAFKCYEYVKELLNKNLYLFDNMEEI
ncbi:MAG: AAC(3) family N-acetyltransferase [Anaeroplasmataceae bacterium]|nr:AAC(3) family N-acetyltransferase [Anaeroplasmataceae bacterium]